MTFSEQSVPEDDLAWLNDAAVIVDPVVAIIPELKVVAGSTTVELIKLTVGVNGVSVPIFAAVETVMELPEDELNVPLSKDSVPQFKE